MNILYIIAGFPSGGGTETVTRTVANELTARGHKVGVACFTEQNAYECFVDPRISIHQLPVSFPFDSRENIAGLHRLLQEESIDIIICQVMSCLTFDRLCTEARKGTRARLVTCIHASFLFRLAFSEPLWPGLLRPRILRSYRHPLIWSLDFLASIASFFHLRRQRKIWRIRSELGQLRIVGQHSNRLVWLSPGFVRQYRKLSPHEHPERCTSIPNPLTLPSENACPLSKERILLYVGRMEEPVKRVQLILAAWAVLSQRPENAGWRLILVGDGPDMDAIRRSANALPRVSVEGYQPPAPYYQKASIFLMTSLFEGFGMTLIEAQQHGCVPVVMDSFVTAHEIIHHGKDGILVPNGRLQAFTDAVQALMDHPEQLQRMAEEAKISCRSFSAPRIVDRWEQLFLEIQKEK